MKTVEHEVYNIDCVNLTTLDAIKHFCNNHWDKTRKPCKVKSHGNSYYTCYTSFQLIDGIHTYYCRFKNGNIHRPDYYQIVRIETEQD